MERLPKETDKAWQAFQDFRDLGRTRDLKVLHSLYQGRKGEKRDLPPTFSYKTLGNWSADHNWADRASQYDAEQALIAAQKVREEEEAKHVEELLAFRQAGNNAAVAAMMMSSKMLSQNHKTISAVLENLNLPASPNPEQALQILSVIEKAQAVTEKAIAQKSLLEGFDKIAKYLEANGHG